MTHSLQAAALRYAATGWPVFLLSRTKQPLALCKPCHKLKTERQPHDPAGCGHLTCHGFYAATLDPRRIRAMFIEAPSGLLAIRTGALSRLVVVDVDGPTGRASLTRLITDGLIPPTRHVRTGGGGFHLYYRHPGGGARFTNSAKKLAPGIDVRGDGGYVVAAPSVHPDTGRPYAWADEDQAITALPAGLLAATEQAASVPAPAPAAVRTGTDRRARYLDAAIRRQLDHLHRAVPGQRNAALFTSAVALGQLVAGGAIGEQEVDGLLTQTALSIGLRPNETAHTIASGLRTGAKRPRAVAV